MNHLGGAVSSGSTDFTAPVFMSGNTIIVRPSRDDFLQMKVDDIPCWYEPPKKPWDHRSKTDKFRRNRS